ncbi:unnamed protein product [Vitrella brassicaformis CCMP3155]|uniref:Uncharacterized protein n=1 Tax=Vitrella brassicaformis (strain CCMP3155) TaxID=1169540 RepID=A0A0G4EQG5_VITBC|nr:unnamed protein product [Vitrella brassicaformis CCMP3155]|eukprot:CEL99711.1 unnamed protein product [Vitrella brassicaformis CCMP3155]
MLEHKHRASAFRGLAIESNHNLLEANLSASKEIWDLEGRSAELEEENRRLYERLEEEGKEGLKMIEPENDEPRKGLDQVLVKVEKTATGGQIVQELQEAMAEYRRLNELRYRTRIDMESLRILCHAFYQRHANKDQR